MQYQTFIFDSYTYHPDTQTIELTYSLDDQIFFTETITHRQLALNAENVDPNELSNALFALHLIGGISYYKTYCPRNIEIRSGQLNPNQAHFWETIYENGLGEFFYRNQIDFRDLIQFPVTATEIKPNLLPSLEKSPSEMRFLVPFGGGKDSIVTSELLKREHLHCTLYRVGQHHLIDDMTQIADLDMLIAERRLSPNLFELNKQGALNGHVPITAYLSILTIVVGLLYGFDAVVMSNEKSASDGNVMFHGMEINHQWSKGLQFETMLRDYIGTYITHRFQYINLLRPFSELEITQFVSSLPKYFSTMTSCNTNWRLLKDRADGDAPNKWCGHCPKCAFCFGLFASFLPKSVLVGMFGDNLFERIDLAPLYRELIGIEGFKPFECVGTAEEVNAAFYLACQNEDYKDSVICQLWSDLNIPKASYWDQLQAVALPLESAPIMAAAEPLVGRG